jgi:hypothetical protein
MKTEKRLLLRDKVKSMFNFAFDSYMNNAFPKDELDPILCKGIERDTNPTHWNINDILGNFSLTLIDSLDMFVIVNDKSGFHKAVRKTIKTIKHFKLDVRVQVILTLPIGF